MNCRSAHKHKSLYELCKSLSRIRCSYPLQTRPFIRITTTFTASWRRLKATSALRLSSPCAAVNCGRSLTWVLATYGMSSRAWRFSPLAFGKGNFWEAFYQHTGPPLEKPACLIHSGLQSSKANPSPSFFLRAMDCLMCKITDAL